MLQKIIITVGLSVVGSLWGLFQTETANKKMKDQLKEEILEELIGDADKRLAELEAKENKK